MGNFTKQGFLLLLLFYGFNAFAQQTVQFSQYLFNGLAVNPAYAGYREEWNACLSYRMQWAGVNGAPRTAVASFDGVTDVSEKRVGLGFIAISDRLGAQSTSSFYGNYAYRLQIDDEEQRRLTFGIAFGVTQYGIDGTRLVAVEPNDISIPRGAENKIYPDFRIGVYYADPRYFIGVSILDMFSSARDQITTDNNYKILKQVRHVYLSGGALFRLSAAMDIKPTFLIKDDFNGPTDIDLNASLLIHKTVWIGTAYRMGVKLWNKAGLQTGLDQRNAIAAIAQVLVSDRFKVGYSYDYSLNALANYQQGSHEISLSLAFSGRNNRTVHAKFF
ncbi:type IX secretion system membrane protein PorP/SprF [Pedobacter sp. JY14-1]|uniref:PorP/SprF family type IX secretion system membrane protein n=1 Tax=Pedobacter sp. JY14-1 TaxID=3034151 RepID=UPI0023E0A32D|nr:type IX secretion system membrane protein PorP/SprF [Pedobacter sp. JY14-1]